MKNIHSAGFTKYMWAASILYIIDTYIYPNVLNKEKIRKKIEIKICILFSRKNF